jgi:hypothetical protein
MSQNIGHSAKLRYDQCAYDDYLNESVGPGLYRMNPISMNHTSRCTTNLGNSRASSHGVSTVISQKIAPKQANVDIESILSNRNVLQSKCKDGKVNDIDVTKFTLQHVPECNNFLDPVNSHLTNPTQNYREIPVNRFYDLRTNPQNHIFYNWSIDTRLETKDNFSPSTSTPMSQESVMPVPLQGNRRIINYIGSEDSQ